jgi:hypothetical protein
MLVGTGVGQNNGNTTNTVHISLLIWCCTTFAFNTAAVLLGMDSYKYWTVCSGMSYHSSWRIPSTCYGNVGGGNLFLTLVSKTDQSASLMFKCGNWAGQEICRTSTFMIFKPWLNSSGCGMRHCLLAKLHFCSDITSGSWDAPDYPTCPRTAIPCSNSAMKGN